MTWTNALGLCPRCDGPVERGLLLCSRCGLELVAPEYLGKKLVPEQNTSVLQTVDVPHKPESRVPAVLVIGTVIVLGTWMTWASMVRQDGIVQATPHATPTALQLATIPTQPPKSLSQVAKPTRTSTPPLTVYTATPPPAATSQPSAPLTYTPVPLAPTTPAAPEAQPAQLLPGIGASASDLNGWWVKLDGLGARPVLWSSNPTTMHESQGTFWLAYMIYRNDSDTPRALGTTVDFAIKGSDGQVYPEYSVGGTDSQRKDIPLALQANPLDFTAAPGQRTTTVLVFDLPSGVEPAQLVASTPDGDSTSPATQVAWDLSNTP